MNGDRLRFSREMTTMVNSIRSATHWVGRHAFPALAATVIAVGAAGGGIGYAVASQHTTATPRPSSSASTSPASPSTARGTAAAGTGRGAEIFHHALSILASQTGQTVLAVRHELSAGKSVDAIAGAKAPAIEGQIMALITKLANHAVTAGRITAQQKTAGLAAAKTKVEALMAEPGTQLLNDAQKAIQFLQPRGVKHGAPSSAASPTPTP